MLDELAQILENDRPHAGPRDVFLHRDVATQDALDHAGQGLSLRRGKSVASQPVSFVQDEDQGHDD